MTTFQDEPHMISQPKLIDRARDLGLSKEKSELLAHRDFFSANLGSVSDEHGERFHLDIAKMEKIYQGRWNPNMLGDYCWGLIREAPQDIYKHSGLLSERMKQLLIKGDDHDVKICVQDNEFRAHRNILRARSPVFAMMFAHDTKENITGAISFEDCDPDTFDKFLLYVYSGRTENLIPSNALHLYYTTDKYDFPVLKERCVNIQKASLFVSSINDVVLLAVKHQEKELLEVATEFFAQNLEEILVSVGWLNFMSQNPVEANEFYIKSMEILLPRK